MNFRLRNHIPHCPSTHHSTARQLYPGVTLIKNNEPCILAEAIDRMGIGMVTGMATGSHLVVGLTTIVTTFHRSPSICRLSYLDMSNHHKNNLLLSKLSFKHMHVPRCSSRMLKYKANSHSLNHLAVRSIAMDLILTFRILPLLIHSLHTLISLSFGE